MRRILTFTTGALLAMSATADMSIFNGYAYVSDTTAGTDAAWYNLSGTAQSQSLDGADLGDFETSLWLGGQTGLWQNEGGVASATLHYAIDGEATAAGSISYAFQNYSDPNDQWGTDANGANLTDISVDLIAAHSLGEGSYTLSTWVQGTANGGTSAWDSNNSANYTATFEVIPEPATIGLTLLVGTSALFIRRMFM